ncbi:MAG: 4a-hydroxytetrahydrobiopterin dehydratase [Aureliella sp.]
MNPIDAESLVAKRCVPCEGGVAAFDIDASREQIKELNGWALSEDGKMIRRKWTLKNFVQGMQLLQKAADLAEQEQHHPDFHLTGYRHVTIELTTHAIGGLSENDFILAAKIDAATEAFN